MNMIKEIPLQYLTPNQFKRWTASVGFSGAAADQFLEDELGDSAEELVANEYHWGKADISKFDIEMEGGETVKIDSVVADKLALETRRALHKTPAFQEDAEYMALLSEHFASRVDKSTLNTEFLVRTAKQLIAGCTLQLYFSLAAYHPVLIVVNHAFRLCIHPSYESVSPIQLLSFFPQPR